MAPIIMALADNANKFLGIRINASQANAYPWSSVDFSLKQHG
jgi:hypothetical protein